MRTNMRIFSKFERKIIKTIISLEKTGQRLRVYSFLEGNLDIYSQITLIGRDNNYKLKDDEQHYHDIEIKGKRKQVNKDYIETSNRLYELNDLIDYLLSYGLLVRHEGSNFIESQINPQEFDENDSEIETIEFYINKTLKGFLEKCSYNYKPTEALRDLVSHNFKTKDERNNRYTRIISIVAIIISFLGLLHSFYRDTTVKPIQQNAIKIDTSSINYLFDKIETNENDSIRKK